ncbi:MAG: DUF1573 domain-containing protein [Chitinophagaceae bacterium]|nr:DUF1573 domain-containing protein [Chitinophagaceae bacterium]
MQKGFQNIVTILLIAGLGFVKPAWGQVSFNRGVYNFGYLQLGKPATGKFLVTNNGKNKIIIEKTWAGCGCTTPKPSATSIAPGQTIQLAVTFNAGAEEAFLKEVYLKFKEIDNIYVLRVKGTVLNQKDYHAKFPQ